MSSADYHKQGGEQIKADRQLAGEIEHQLAEKFERWEALEAKKALPCRSGFSPTSLAAGICRAKARPTGNFASARSPPSATLRREKKLHCAAIQPAGLRGVA